MEVITEQSPPARFAVHCAVCHNTATIDYVTGIGNVIQAPGHSVLRANTFSMGARAVTKKMARVKNGPPGPSFSAKIGPPLQKLARARRHLVWSLRVIWQV